MLGNEILKQYFDIETNSSMIPTLVEEKFSFSIDNTVFLTGFWDRIDILTSESAPIAVIKEFKTNLSSVLFFYIILFVLVFVKKRQ